MKQEARSRILRWAAPVGLVAVATWQILSVALFDLTPWKGGGFGMFSSVDNPGMRTVRCFASLKDDQGREVETLLSIQGISFEIDQSIRAARMRPTQAGLDRLARQVASLSFVLAPRDSTTRDLELQAWAEGTQHPGQAVRVESVRLELSKALVDEGMRVHSTVLLSASLRRRPETRAALVAQVRTP